MQTRLLTATLALAATVSLAACTTRPVVIDTPGPGQTTVQVPVPASANMMLDSRVKATLESAMGSNAAGIDVKAEEGTIYLTGRVATRALHDQAIAVARGTAGVTLVVHSGLVVSN